MSRAAICQLLFTAVFITCSKNLKAQQLKPAEQASKTVLPQPSLNALSGSFGKATSSARLILRRSLLHDGGNKVYQITAPKKLVRGLYKFSVSNPAARRIVLNVSVME